MGATIATNTILFGSLFEVTPTHNVNILRTLEDGDVCEYTGQGKAFVTDDQGYICKWKDWNAMSLCCKETEQTSIPRFSCQNCNTSASCCSIYEYCVSCCMAPEHSYVREHVSKHSDSRILKNAKNSFDFCKGVCRTNSKSIYLQNKYRNEDKYCYGVEAPPLQNTTETIVTPVNLIDSSSGNSSPRINSNPSVKESDQSLSSQSDDKENKENNNNNNNNKHIDNSYLSVSPSLTGSITPSSSSKSSGIGNSKPSEKLDSQHVDISSSNSHVNMNDESNFKFGIATRENANNNAGISFSILSLQYLLLMCVLLLFFVF